MELVAVADILEERVQEAKERYHLKEENCFRSAKELLAAERLADILFICTQDRRHVEQAVAAIKKGYHILLEKPVSPNAQECDLLLKTAEQYQRKVCVCHVLRYTPFYSKIQANALRRYGWTGHEHSGAGGRWIFSSGALVCPR